MADLATLDPSAVASALEASAALVAEIHPTADLKGGPLRDLVVYPHAVLATSLRADLAAYLSARSLSLAAADPAGADPSVVDAILSNFLVTRSPASSASGEVVVVVSTDATVVVAAGAVFAAGASRYVTTRAYVAKAEPGLVVGAGDRLITRLTGGGYAFTVPVVASSAGASGYLKKDAALLPLSPPPGFVRAYAASDFAGAADAETTRALLARLPEAVSARCPANRAGAAALLRGAVDFAALSVVGCGDAEMTRDRRPPFPAPSGGRVDWYVRTQRPLLRTGLDVTATLVGWDASGDGVWQFSLGRDAAPGFYEVRNVRPAGSDPASVAGGYAVVSDERTLDFSDDDPAPDALGVVEGAYSRYQAATVRFTAPAVGLSAGATAAFRAEAVGQPSVAACQAAALDRATAVAGSDVLVRAAVPCFVSVSLRAHAKDAAAVDPAAVASAVADAVNASGFAGTLYASDLLAAARSALGGAGVSGVDLFGRVRRPDGTDAYVRSPEALEAPDEPSRCVSPRTVAFYCDPADVAVTVLVSAPPV